MKPRELTDWTFGDEFAREHPIMVIACVASGDAPARRLVDELSELATQFEPRVRFFTVDLTENPSMRVVLRVPAAPAVVIYEHGRETHRFRTPGTARGVARILARMLRSREAGNV